MQQAGADVARQAQQFEQSIPQPVGKAATPLGGGDQAVAQPTGAQPGVVGGCIAVDHVRGPLQPLLQHREQQVGRLRQLFDQLAELLDEGGHDQGDRYPNHQHQSQQAQQQGRQAPQAQPPADHAHQSAQGHGQDHGGKNQQDGMPQAPKQQPRSHQADQSQPLAKFQASSSPVSSAPSSALPAKPRSWLSA